MRNGGLCLADERPSARKYSETTAGSSDPRMPDEFQRLETDQPTEHALVLPAELAGLRLDQVLARLLPQYSRARIQAWIRAGRVLVDGHAPRARDQVLGGERVVIA